MITALEYRLKNNELMIEYEKRVRTWLKNKGEIELFDKIPFFRDGVTCPEKWFEAGNDFRPLFIMKEVSLGIDNKEELDAYLDVWGTQKFFEFVENPFDDIQVGKFSTWIRIARLAKGLEEIHNGSNNCDYYKYNFSFEPGGEDYKGDIEGYKQYGCRTANMTYNDIIKKIAVLEIKKIGGGRSVQTELSVATGYYSEHIKPFEDLICRQIELINPTVIICCSREYYTQKLLSTVKENTSERLWIYGYHPRFSSNKNFYEEPLRIYKNR